MVETAGVAGPARSAQPITGGRQRHRCRCSAVGTPARLDAITDSLDVMPEAGPALVVPLRTTETVAGVLVILRRRGAADSSPTSSWR